MELPTFGRLSASLVTARDLLALQACLQQCDDYFRQVEGRGVTAESAADLWADVAADPRRRLYLVRDRADGAACGVLDLTLDCPQPAEVTIALFALVPEARGQGLGTELCRDLFGLFECRGVEAVRLGVRLGAAGAAEFWTSLGLVECGGGAQVREFRLALARSEGGTYPPHRR